MRVAGFAIFVAAVVCRGQGIITTIAGTDITYPGTSFPALSASFGVLGGVAVSPSGGVYFTSQTRSLILRFDPNANTVSIVAGIALAGYSGDGGPASSAALNRPLGIAFDPAGNLYFADTQNNAIRKIDTHGIITTVATGPNPTGITVAEDGSLYFSTNAQVLHLTSAGTVVPVAGIQGQGGYNGDDIPAIDAELNGPGGFVFDSAGNLFIADTGNYRIRRVDTKGIITTFAGNGQTGSAAPGPATATAVSFFAGLAIDHLGNLYLGNTLQLLRIDPNGNLSVLDPFQQGGPSTQGVLGPYFLAFDALGNLYYSDSEAGYLWEVTNNLADIQIVAAYAPNFAIGDGGLAVLAGLSSPFSIWLASDGSLLIADLFDQRVRRVSTTGVITTVAGNGSFSYPSAGPALATAVGLAIPDGVASDSSGNIYVEMQGDGILYRVDATGALSLFYNDHGTIDVNGIATDANGNLYAASTTTNQIVSIPANGLITVIAGTGHPGFLGDNGPAVAAELNAPGGLALDSAGNIYIADSGNGRVRRIAANGIITTIAGGGLFEVDGVPATQSALFPTSIACDNSGNVYVGEAQRNRVRKIAANGIITTVAGTGQSGFSGDGGPGTSAMLNFPTGVAADNSGNVYITDTLNNRIRKVLAPPPAISVSSTQVALSAPSLGAPVQTSITVSSTVAGLGYLLSVATSTGGNWLSSSASQGQAPGTISIIANPGNLQPATYQGTVTIASAFASPAAITIQVTFQVTPGIAASLAANPGQVGFSVTAASAPVNAQLTISNQGGGTLSFNVTAATVTGGAWLQVSPVNGTASAGAPASAMVTATPGSLSAGTYTGSITVTSAATSLTITIPVTLAINPAPQTILLSQAGLTFTAVAQGGSVIPQSFGILNTGSGSMSWTATTNVLSGSGWLNVSPASGTVNQPLLDVSFVNVSVNPGGLAAGEYFGSVQISAPGASNSPQTVTIVLDVLPAGSNPGPQVLPSGLVFTGIAGGENPGAQTVTIANTTSVPHVYGSSVSYVSGNDWINYLPANATVVPQTLAQVTVQPNFANLAAGVFRAALNLAFDDGSVRNVTILAVVAPAGTLPAARIRSNPTGVSGCTPVSLNPSFTQVGTGPAVSTGFPVAIVAEVVDNCGNPMTSGSVTLSFTNGDPALSMINLQNGEWSATWQPRTSSPSGVTISLLAQQGLLTGTISTLIGFQGAQSLPVALSVVNAVTLAQGPVAPGELVWIKGSGLADGQAVATGTPLKQQLGGAQVFLGTTLANLLYVDAAQLIGQVPFTVPVNTSQQIILERDASSGVPSPVIVAAAQPAIFTADGSGLGQALIYNASSSGASAALADSTNPAQPGGAIIIYCAGLGAVTAQGTASNPVSVSIGGVAAQVTYAGTAIAANYPSGEAPAILGLVSAGLGGLYEIHAVVPSGVASGAAAVIVSAAGQSSPPGVTMAIAGGPATGPVPVPAGVVNAASFAKDSTGAGAAVAPGSLIQVYSSLVGATAASAEGAPFPASLGGVSVTFDGISAPIQSVVPTGAFPFINVQLPFEITNSTTSMVVMVNGVPSAPMNVPVTPQAPGVFTSPPDGQHNAIFVYLDPVSNTAKIAAPASQASAFTIPVAPIPRGTSGFFYATGLGALNPSLTDGTAPSLTSTTVYNAAQMPSALVGGVPAQVIFAGQAPGYPGVNQINITIPANAPTGNAVPLQVMSADGRVLSTPGATIAIQ